MSVTKTTKKHLYILQHKHTLKIYVKTRQYGQTQKHLADQFNTIQEFEVRQEHYEPIQQSLLDQFKNLNDLTPSKANCDKIDAIITEVTGFPVHPSTFDKSQKFEFCWPEAARAAVKRAIPPEDQHKKVYPLYLHRVTKIMNQVTTVRMWLSDTVLNTTNNPIQPFYVNHTYAEVVAVYIFHSIADRQAALKAVSAHEGDWETLRDITPDKFQLKALETVLEEVSGVKQPFDIVSLCGC